MTSLSVLASALRPATTTKDRHVDVVGPPQVDLGQEPDNFADEANAGLAGAQMFLGAGCEEQKQPLNLSQANLYAALCRFYEEQKEPGKRSNLDRIVRRYSADQIVHLWAALGIKYALPPHVAVKWLTQTMPKGTIVQWKREDIPSGVCLCSEALDVFSEDQPPSSLHSWPSDSGRALLLQLESAVNSGHVSEAAALVFWSDDCTALRQLRSRVWRLLIRGHVDDMGRRERPPGRFGRSRESFDLTADEGRIKYAELQFRHLAPAAQSTQQHEYRRDAVEADVAAAISAWQQKQAEHMALSRDFLASADPQVDTFLANLGVRQAIGNIVLIHARDSEQYMYGTCDIVAMLLFVMCADDLSDLQDAEADAYWCLHQLTFELSDRFSEEWRLSGQIGRLQSLLRTYDPALARRLQHHGLSEMPEREFGIGLLTQSRFPLRHCARLWDFLLADPQRMQFLDYVIIALLVSSREELLEQLFANSLAEKLADCVVHVDVVELIGHAKSICAFERLCARGHVAPYPTRCGPAPVAPLVEAADAMVEAAQAGLKSWWKDTKQVSKEAWKKVENVSKKAWEEIRQGPHPDSEDATDQSLDTTADLSPSMSKCELSLNSGECDRTLLNTELAECLLDHLPAVLRLPGAVEWVLRYSPKVHGVSLGTLYRNLATCEKTVTIIQDVQDHIFGGFASLPWQQHKAFYGTGESFVFSFGKVEGSPDLRVYTWVASRNSFFMYSDMDYFSMGGGDGSHAFLIRDDLLRGGSTPTPTFGNPALASAGEFVVKDLEIWALEEIP